MSRKKKIYKQIEELPSNPQVYMCMYVWEKEKSIVFFSRVLQRF